MLGFYTRIGLSILLGKHRHLWSIRPPCGKEALYKFAGKFKYKDLPGGFVEILGNWEKNNIVDVYVPIVNPKSNRKWHIRCHKNIERQIFDIFSTYAARGYDKSYPIYQLGCFVPRHKMSNPKRSLSIHSYGLAIDINWKVNKVGTRGNMPAEVVTLFKQYGFNWGGFWTRPKDPMHFQFYSEK